MKKPKREEFEIVELYSEKDIQEMVQILAREIAEDFKDLMQQKNFQLVLVGILNGAVPFIGDLARALSKYFPLGILEIDYLAISSHREGGPIRLEKDTKKPLKNKHVLVVEDITDTGRTLEEIMKIIAAKDPASIRICVLIDRYSPTEKVVKPDYVGFTVCKPHWLVGYGLDDKGIGRELPFIGYLKR